VNKLNERVNENLKDAWGAKREDKVKVTKLLMHHEAEDSHHGSAAVVELNCAFLELIGRAQVVPHLVDTGAGVLRKVGRAVTDITRESRVSGVVASHVEVNAAKTNHEPREVGHREDAESSEPTWIQERSSEKIENKRESSNSGK